MVPVDKHEATTGVMSVNTALSHSSLYVGTVWYLVRIRVSSVEEIPSVTYPSFPLSCCLFTYSLPLTPFTTLVRHRLPKLNPPCVNHIHMSAHGRGSEVPFRRGFHPASCEVSPFLNSDNKEVSHRLVRINVQVDLPVCGT